MHESFWVVGHGRGVSPPIEVTLRDEWAAEVDGKSRRRYAGFNLYFLPVGESFRSIIGTMTSNSDGSLYCRAACLRAAIWCWRF